MTMMPTGFRFNPTDEELIQILERKVYGQEMPLHGHFIVERNVYEFDPQDLEWEHNMAVPNNERYCYCIKENDSREVSGRGWWRATGHVKTIYANEHVVGFKRPLTFHRFTGNDKKRNTAIKTNWIMHEYNLESNTTDWRLCKIKYKGKLSAQEEMENCRKGATPGNKDVEASSSIIGEQLQQPQQLQLENSLCEPCFEAISPMEMQEQSDHLLQLDNVCELYFTQNMLLEVIDEKLHQSKASCDPYFFDGQIEQPADSSEQLFLSLWSWQN
ncbi:NAC domain-containing protein 41-like [Mangifera indica]|uniref:NAC domain-containing protein 41-like n=1 Tax=Mangifera indica TaxID=29780 RepID=UPI001CF9B15C|nr:NAC domain-containing protein 41-like [Mangifera indica]XP_044481127.1 NAC domain-containing protein 41-like [Mangifera indica]XP_044481361.1 NAC domain-containing protein 41-like [Mangifera indica]